MSTTSPGPPGLVRLVATAGHVDHGKSTLVQALTGTDPDRLPEERRRHLTIDLGFAHAELTPGVVLSFIDVPGHVRFLRNMLAGVGAVAGCLFVVDAREGWMPQSEEHLRILDLLALRDGVVALTKSDLVDEETRRRRRTEVRDPLAGSFLEDAPVVMVDAVGGSGLSDLRVALVALARRLPAAADRGRPRLWVDRAFTIRGAGTVVTGTLTDGSLRVDDEILVAPHGFPARIRGLEVHHRAIEEVGPGHRVALNLAGISTAQVHRGDAVVGAGGWQHTRRIDVGVDVLPSASRPLTSRGSPLAYIGSGEHAVSLRVIGPKSIEPGAAGRARLDLPVALPLVAGDRFVLRDAGRNETVGGGEILDVDPVLPVGRADPDRSVARVVRERGRVRADDLERLTGLPAPPGVGDWVVDPAVRERIEAELRTRVAGAGALGLEIATLEEHEQAILDTLPGVSRVRGRAVADGAAGGSDRPDSAVLARLDADPFAPGQPAGDELAEAAWLARQGHAVRAGGLWFSRSAVDGATDLVGELLGRRPEGVTVAEVREAMGTTRRFALALLGLLDDRGITRRVGSARVAGPRGPWRGADADADGRD